MTILTELQAAAARKWTSDPACQQAGLFARAVAELERLTHENANLRECVRTARADEAHCWARRVAGLTQTLRDEMDENLRLRELGVAWPDEAIGPFVERLIRERDELRAELGRKGQ